jgi:hypothetical protein
MRSPSLVASVLVALLSLPRLASAQAPTYPPEPPPPGAPNAPPPPQPDVPQPFAPQPYQPEGQQPYTAPPPPPYAPPSQPRRQPIAEDELAANTGIQLVFETGYSLPLGNADANTKQSDFFSAQVPLLLHLAYKPIANLGIGGFVGVGFGGSGDALSSTCSRPGVTCVGGAFRLGIEAQVSFLPAARVDPYIGLGLGLESSGISASNGNQTVRVGLVGPELARLTFGADYRISRMLGIGPFTTLAIGRYSSLNQDAGNGSVSRDLAEKALHEWLTLGLRLTVFP